MAVSPIRPRRPHPAEDEVVEDLRVSGARARERGWRARLVDLPVDDESDLRLVVRRPGASTRVEVLGPCPNGLPLGCRWQAVRVRAGQRDVWSGPVRAEGPARLLAFVADLLEDDDEELGRRYEPLG
jgi:hypothetical protein